MATACLGRYVNTGHKCSESMPAVDSVRDVMTGFNGLSTMGTIYKPDTETCLCRQPDTLRFTIFDEVRDHGFDRVDFVPDVDGNPSYIHVSCDTKLKSTAKNETTETSEFPSADPAVRFTSETSGHLSRDMSSMEMSIRNVFYIALVGVKTTSTTDTDRNKPDELVAEHHSPWFWCCPTIVEASGMTFSQAVHHRWRCMFPCGWKFCPSQSSRYDASGSMTFLLSITMCDVDIRRDLRPCRVTAARPCLQRFCNAC